MEENRSELLLSQTLDRARTHAQSMLRTFATAPDFNDQMQQAFGEGIPAGLQPAWASGLFGNMPAIEVRSSAEINGARGAFAGETNKIYLSREFLSGNASNIEAVVGVLLEEFGHAFDWQWNEVDRAGDEGALFSALVRGETLTPQQLQRLQAEDDRATVTLDGQEVEIEQAVIEGTDGDDTLSGTDEDDIFVVKGGGNDLIADTGGIDTIDASEASTDSFIDIKLGSNSTIDESTVMLSGLVTGNDLDVVFVIDISFSADDPFGGTPVGDINGDGQSDTILDAEIAGAIALNQQLIDVGLGEIADVGIVAFAGSAFQSGEVTTPSADNDDNGILDVEDALRSLRTAAFTNFESGLQIAEGIFTTLETAPGDGTLIFLSDGAHTGGSFIDEVDSLEALGINLRAFGVGAGASLPQLQTIDPIATSFTNTDELLSAFGDLTLIENAIGSAFNDTILGNNADNQLQGNSGNDSLVGSGGSDTLEGGSGDDTYELNAETAAGSKIQDTEGSNDRLILPGLSLATPAAGIIGVARSGTTLLIDINQDGVASPEDDLAIDEFFTPLELSVDDVTITESSEGTTNAIFTVSATSGVAAGAGFIETVDEFSGTEILNFLLPTVAYATANGTAIAGTDFIATSGTLTFNPGETTQTISVEIVDDAEAESDESFFLNLSTANNADIADNQGEATISDNDTDSPVGDGFADVVLDYFDSGAGPIPGPYGGAGSGSPVAVDVDVVIGNNSSFLSLPTGSFVTVGFTDETVIDGPGNDIFIQEVGSAGEQAEVFVSFNLVDFTLLGIANGATITAFDLASIGFTNPVQAVKIVGLDSRGGSPGFDVVSVQVLPDSIGAATPSVIIASGIFPSEEGSTAGTFTITLDRAASAEGLILNYSLNGTATLATDFLLEASDNVTNVTDNQITIAGVQTTATVNVIPVDDAVFDPDETVELTLTAGVGYNIGADGSASLIIADNDIDIPNEAPTDIQLSSTSVDENSADNTVIGVFTTTDPDPGDTHTYTLVNDAGDRFAIDGDRLVVADGSRLDFETDSSHIIVVRTTDNEGREYAESFTIAVNDVFEPDPTVEPATLTVAIAADEISEDASNPATTATVTRNNATADPLVVSLQGDPTQLTIPDTVTIPAQSNSVTFDVTVVDDGLTEDVQEINIIASAPDFTSGSDLVVVLDNDQPNLTVTLADDTISEGDISPATIGTVTRDIVNEQSVEVILESSDLDAVAVPLRVTIPANEADVTFPVSAVNDDIEDGPQTATITAFLTDSLDLPVDEGSGSATITVTDDDNFSLFLSTEASIIAETGTTTATVTRNRVTGDALVVNLSSSDPSEAIVPETVTIPASVAEVTFEISGVDDGVIDESQAVKISATAEGFEQDLTTIEVSDVGVPDLLVTEVAAPDNLLTDQTSTVTYRVENRGTTDANGSWVDRVYLSTDNQVGDDRLLGEYQFSGTQPQGLSYERTVPVTLPETPGEYWLVVATDEDGQVNEGDGVGDRNNTTISATPISIGAAYQATVAAEASTGLIGNPMTLSGQALSNADGSPVANVPVTVEVQTQGTSRDLEAFTDSNGNYEVLFQPLPGEAGIYQINATHPNNLEEDSGPEDEFALVGMELDTDEVSHRIFVDAPFSERVELENLAEIDLSEITATVEGAPDDWTVEVNVPQNLAGLETSSVDYTITAPEGSLEQDRFDIRLESAEGAVAVLPVNINVEPPVPRLVADTSVLQRGMVRGDQTCVEVEVTNAGGAETGEIAVLLPEESWLSLGTQETISSLAPGESTIVTLILTPESDLPLVPFEGGFVLDGAEPNADLLVPFNFRAISEAVGDVEVSVVDEFTFYAEGEPKVENAEVNLIDPFTQTVVAEGVTDETGMVLFQDVAEGQYSLQVESDNHGTFRAPYTVIPGIVDEEEVFVTRETVSYNWTVVPTEIEDEYRIELQSVFEANVPAPVVTVDDPFIMPLVVPGRTTQVEVSVTNHGLIAANDVQIQFPDNDPNYIIEPLIDVIGELPAQSTVTIPVLIRLREEVSTNTLSAQASDASDEGSVKTSNIQIGGGCNDLVGEITYNYVCGENRIWRRDSVTSKPIVVPDENCILDAFDNLGSTTTGVIFQELIESGSDILKWAKSLNPRRSPTVPAAAVGIVLNSIIDCSNLEDCDKAWLKLATGIVSGAAGGALGGLPSIALGGAIGLISGIGDVWNNCCFDLGEPNPVSVSGGVGGGDFVLPYVAPRSFEISTLGCTPGDTFSVTRPVFRPKSTASTATASAQSSLSSESGCIDCEEKALTGAENPALLASAEELTNAIVTPAETDQGVCARVRIKIEQEAVLTRSAFLATLEIDNDSDNTIVEDISVTLDIRDLDGNQVMEQFGIRPAELEGLNAIDGTGLLNPNSAGSAEFTIIPTSTAAPEEPIRYTVGGTLSYKENGQAVTIPLFPAPITVFPQAELRLDYFQQRDVFADDPFTDEVEPSVPFSLGLLVTNEGAGAATDLRITSAQPKIIENEKGLLVDFKILGTQIGTESVTPSLTADLGDIEANDTAVATWLLESSLQGKFIEYEASFEHVNDLNVPELSLIKETNIHELIKQVRVDVPADDELPDFLVNDIPDDNFLPDTLYLSDGTTEAVTAVTDATTDSPATVGDLEVQVTATMPDGWGYLRIEDPADGQFQISRVLRSDGTELRVEDNVWRTDRTFPEEGRPIIENILHLLDYNETGEAIDYTIVYASDDLEAPQIADIVDISPDPGTTAISTIEVEFSEAIDPATFDFSDIALTLNGGANLITNAIAVEQLTSTTFEITSLEELTSSDGQYQLTVDASGITDLSGNAGVEETLSETWTKAETAPAIASIAGVTGDRLNAPVAGLDVTFTKPIDRATFDISDLTLTFNEGANLISNAVTITAVSDSAYRIEGLRNLTSSDGDYEFTINATGITDQEGNAGVGDRAVNWTVDGIPLTIAAISEITTTPRNIPVESLEVTFNKAIDPETFDFNDIVLTNSDSSNLITREITVTELTESSLEILGLSELQGTEGTYEITINGSDIFDLAGNQGSNSLSQSWVLDLTAPAAPSNLILSPNLGADSSDGLINTISPTISGELAETNLKVFLRDETVGEDLGQATVADTEFTGEIELSAPGIHSIQVRTVDAAGNVSTSSLEIFADLTLPTVTEFQNIPLEPVTTAVSFVDVVFDEAIDLSTFDYTDIALIRDGGNNLIGEAVTISELSDATYRIDGLGDLTDTVGSYELIVDTTTIQDLAGNTGEFLATTAIEIISNEADASIVAFSSPNYQVNEDGTVVDVAITIERTNNTSEASTVAVQLTNGIAAGGTPPFAEGVDFDNSIIPIEFAPDRTSAVVTIPINDDDTVEGTEDLTLELVNASEGTAIGPQNTATVFVTDNDSDTEQINLDIDGNGVPGAFSDGVLALRYLNGETGDDLTDGAIAAGATRTTAAEITSYLDAAVDTMLDVDGNGTAEAQTDGILIFRYLVGLTEDALISGAIGGEATRTTAAEIIAHLQPFDVPTASQAILPESNNFDIRF